MNTETWIKEALRLAEEAAAQDEVPVGAVLVHEGEVLGRGANNREASGLATGHAEIIALQAYSRQTGQWRLPPGTALFVTVEPCLMCTGALLWARVSEIYFGCSDPRRGGLLTLLPLIESGRWDHRFDKVQGGLEEERSQTLMKAFFKAKRESKINSVINAAINPD